jgi:hypothetical protein
MVQNTREPPHKVTNDTRMPVTLGWQEKKTFDGLQIQIDFFGDLYVTISSTFYSNKYI